jgi:FHA domain
MRGRSRKRWAVVAGVATGWAVLMLMTRSFVVGTALLLLLAAVVALTWVGFRLLGVTREHPWVRGMASRPWRDGQDVLQLSLRHLAEVFVVTPSGSLLAPNSIELRLSPRDYESLGERMDYSLVASSAAEVYAEQVAAHGAHFASYGPAEVRVLSDPAVPEGRYQLRQARPLGAAAQSAPEPRAFQVPQPAPGPQAFQVPQPVPAAAKPGWPLSHDGRTSAEPMTATAARPGPPTVNEAARPAIPLLRLATGDDVVETQASGARAGRGTGVELLLPDVPTVSREHARFTYSDGQWWIANLGLNGLTLNGIALAGEHPLRDGDTIRWGKNQDAPVSRVRIG